jgi:hypothetical protein
VSDVFAAVYDAENKQWQYPIFFNKADYSGDTTSTSIKLGSGATLVAYRRPDDDHATSTAKPERFPVLLSLDCHQKRIHSASDYLQQQKRKNMLQGVQNASLGCSMGYCDYLLYKQSTQIIVPHYTPCK